MIKAEEQRLQKLGYNLDLESLLNDMPDSMWITLREKSTKRKPVSFVITRHDKKWVITLSATNDATNEVYILERIVEDKIKDAVGRMILFMEENKMLEPNV